MCNPVQPQPCPILSVRQESAHEWTFRVATDARPQHGQFMQLSIPKVGEAPISVSAQGEGWRTGLVPSFVPEIPFDSFGGDYAVLVVGPPPMMKFTGLALMANGVEAEKVWMSFGRKMSCAVGKCGHCRIDEVYVCLDGPVFPYTVARDLVD